MNAWDRFARYFFLAALILSPFLVAPSFAKITGPPVKPPEQTPFPEDAPTAPPPAAKGQAPATGGTSGNGTGGSADNNAVSSSSIVVAPNETSKPVQDTSDEAYFWLVALASLSAGAVLLAAHLVLRREDQALTLAADMN